MTATNKDLFLRRFEYVGLCFRLFHDVLGCLRPVLILVIELGCSSYEQPVFNVACCSCMRNVLDYLDIKKAMLD